MSYNVTEADTFPTTVPTPETNDTSYPTVVPQSVTALANRTRYHENTLTGSAGTETFGPELGAEFLGNLTVPSDGRADLLRNGLLTLRNSILWLRARVPGARAAGAS